MAALTEERTTTEERVEFTLEQRVQRLEDAVVEFVMRWVSVGSSTYLHGHAGAGGRLRALAGLFDEAVARGELKIHPASLENMRGPEPWRPRD